MDSMQILHILLVAMMVIIVLSIVFVFFIATHTGSGIFKDIIGFFTNSSTNSTTQT